MMKSLNLLTRVGLCLSLLAGAYSAEAMRSVDEASDPAHVSPSRSPIRFEDIKAQKQAFFGRLQEFTPENLLEMRHILGFIENRVPGGACIFAEETPKTIQEVRRWVWMFDFMRDPQNHQAFAVLRVKTLGETYKEGVAAAQDLLGRLTLQKQAEVLRAKANLDPALMKQFAIIEEKDFHGTPIGSFAGMQPDQAQAAMSEPAYKFWQGYSYASSTRGEEVTRVPFWKAQSAIFRTQFVDLLSVLPEADAQQICAEFQAEIEADDRMSTFDSMVRRMPKKAPYAHQRVLHAAVASVCPETESFEKICEGVRSSPLQSIDGLKLGMQLMTLANPYENPESARVLELNEMLHDDFAGMIEFDATPLQRILFRTLFTEMKPYIGTDYHALRTAIKDGSDLKEEARYYALLSQVMTRYAALDDAQRDKIRERMVKGRETAVTKSTPRKAARSVSSGASSSPAK